MKNQKFLTASFVILGLVLAVVNFLIYQGLAFDSTPDIKRALSAAKAQSTILPDIKKSEPISKSEIHNTEVKKIQSFLPYSDQENKFAIVYYEKPKIISAQIQADSLSQYRERKAIAESKLAELGSTNVCNLVVYWAPPATLSREVNKADLTTTNCP